MTVDPPVTPPGADPSADAQLDAVLAEGVTPRFQPIVDLERREIVGYEALARGPAGSPLERPDQLFAAARATRRLAEVDHACTTAALEAGLTQGLGPPLTLFVNVEPEALGTPMPPEHEALVRRAAPRLDVVVELTERALTRDPAALLRTVERVHARGWGIALDDVGADLSALALLPLLAPDVIKLDLRLVQQRPSPEIAEIVGAVNHEAERRGAAVVAEGIEDADHERTALALGARLGQGWGLGRPMSAPQPVPPPSRPVRSVPQRRLDPRDSPAQDVSAHPAVRIGDKALLIEVSKHLESQARQLGATALLLSTFQEARHFTPATRRRYADLADHVAFVAAYGAGMPPQPVHGVRGAMLAPEDPVVGEWDLTVVSPHFTAALLARDLGDDGPERDRRFAFVLTHQPDEVLHAAQLLMRRVAADGAAEPASWERSDVPAVPAAAGRGLVPRASRRTTGAERELSREIAGRSLAEHALAATEEAVAVVEPAAGAPLLTQVNAAFARLTGYGAREAQGRDLELLAGRSTDPHGLAELARAAREGRGASVLLRIHQRDGTPRWVQARHRPVRDEHGRPARGLLLLRDLTEEVEARDRARDAQQRDGLTGLLDRQRLRRVLETTLHADPHGSVALVDVDLDDFSGINQRAGLDAADAVLTRAAQRLRSLLGPGDEAGRLGSDELGLLLIGTDANGAAARRTAERALAALRAPFPELPASVAVTASAGVAVSPGDGATAGALLAAAEQARAAAARSGGDRLVLARAGQNGERQLASS